MRLPASSYSASCNSKPEHSPPLSLNALFGPSQKLPTSTATTSLLPPLTGFCLLATASTMGLPDVLNAPVNSIAGPSAFHFGCTSLPGKAEAFFIVTSRVRPVAERGTGRTGPALGPPCPRGLRTGEARPRVPAVPEPAAPPPAPARRPPEPVAAAPLPPEPADVAPLSPLPPALSAPASRE